MGGIDWNRAFTTIFMPSFRLAIRIGRSARNVRRDFSEASESLPLVACSRMPMTTIRKSRTFHEFRRYPLADEA